ncbi:PTS sugar transporter subunit IIA [Spirochaeta isovalerica]|uniref:Mannitol/fructose-specific phosphotransferase system IIA component (Ntr-type) n=1 Tax=Spirochaeta isovalerica TaxID=150 RepID=A0A841RDE5_9SPIO|nr:PTS sugar transporter subunit IIA [Spirochaeta isovalerica]MBB6482055.1 mannitol/fructose-specific phosphotransferase system IIA component (Ntr-type) [Spirochaeta isovalerica]
MDLIHITDVKSCSCGIKAKTKDDVLRKLAKLAVKSIKLDNISEEEVYKKIKERESQGSTGFGGEIAIPHARIKGMEEFLLFIVTDRKGVDFDSLDKKKVRLLFVILGPEEAVNEHLQILASISRAMSQERVKKELLGATTESVLVETFLKYTMEKEEKTSEKRKMKLMILVLYLDEFLYHILEYFIQEGIEGATIMDSSGMGEYISSIPLFATFIGFMNEKKNHSKTIFVLIPENKEAEIVRGIEEITGDLDKKEGAMILTTDISFYKGTMKMM